MKVKVAGHSYDFIIGFWTGVGCLGMVNTAGVLIYIWFA